MAAPAREISETSTMAVRSWLRLMLKPRMEFRRHQPFRQRHVRSPSLLYHARVAVRMVLIRLVQRDTAAEGPPGSACDEVQDPERS